MKIIIKIGTSTLTHSSGCINIRRIEKLCKVISDIKNAGNEVIMVSSGAIAMGRGKLNLKEVPRNVAEKQAFAASRISFVFINISLSLRKILCRWVFRQ